MKLLACCLIILDAFLGFFLLVSLYLLINLPTGKMYSKENYISEPPSEYISGIHHEADGDDNDDNVSDAFNPEIL